MDGLVTFSGKENYAHTQQSIHVYAPLIHNININTATNCKEHTNNYYKYSGSSVCDSVASTD